MNNKTNLRWPKHFQILPTLIGIISHSIGFILPVVHKLRVYVARNVVTSMGLHAAGRHVFD